MTDLICRKTMTRCLAAGMCSPHGGCRPELTPTAQSLLVERDRLQGEVHRLEIEVEGLRASQLHWVSEPNSGLIRCVSDERYRKFSPSIRARYRPVRVIDKAMTKEGTHE